MTRIVVPFGARLAAALLAVSVAMLVSAGARGASADEARLAEAADVLRAFTTDDATSIPADLLARAHGIAVIPNVIRGGFLLGARRGRGVLAIRMPGGEWSNPAMITLTGGSIGWQFGAESADVVLIFANERSVRHIDDGKFTLGGDLTAVAGPRGRRTTAALTGRAEVYAYVESRGLFAGAAFEGARLDVDEDGSALLYAADPRAEALEAQNQATPAAARRFLLALEQAASVPAPRAAPAEPSPPPEEAQIFPLGGPQ